MKALPDSVMFGFIVVLALIALVAAIAIGNVNILTPGNDGDSTQTESPSGLELIDGAVAILRGCSDNQILKWDETDTEDDWNCENDSTGAGGGIDTIKEDNVQIGDQDIATLDFGTGFDCSESPDTEINCTVDTVEFGDSTFGSGSDFGHTFNASGATDSVFDFGNGTINVSTGEIQEGGNALISVGDTDTVTTTILDDAADAPVTGECLLVAAATTQVEYDTCPGGGSGDNVSVNSTGADTTANFLDGDIDFTLVDGGAGGPDDITATVGCTDCVALTTETTGNYVLSVSNGNGIAGGDGGSEGAGLTIAINLTDDADGTSATTASESGLEFLTNELSMLRGCSNGEILKFTLATEDWGCSADSTGGSPTFDSIATGANTTADMTVGSGATLVLATGGHIESDQMLNTVNNDSGATLFECTAVFISGFDIPSDLPEVSIADADNAAAIPAIGLMHEDAANGADSFVVVSGSLAGLDTVTGEGWAVGDTVFLNDSGTSADTDCGNTLTNVRPANTDDNIQGVGIVERVHATNGLIKIIGAGRTNDIPNLDDDSVWIGSATNVGTITAIPDCDDGAGHLNYDTATNSWDCGTIDDDVPESGDFGNAVDLDTTGAVVCTDCLNATEIEDIYVLISGDTMTGDLVVDSEVDHEWNPTVTEDATFGDADEGQIQLGTFTLGQADDTVDTTVLDDIALFFNAAPVLAENISFMFMGPAGIPRFVLASEGADLSTYNPRSLTVGFAATLSNVDENILCSTNFSNIDCDTGGTGADLGVQDDVEILDDLFIGDDLQISGAITTDLNFNDGVTDSPKSTYTPATGTAWDIFVEDTGDDLQIEVNTASTEALDVVNVGAGVANLNVDGTITGTTAVAGPNVTSGADPGHTHTGASLSSIDVSDDTNLAAGRSLTLSGDSVEADAELFTRIFDMILTDPTTADDALLQKKAASAATITRVSCSTDVGTVTIQLDERVETTPNTGGTDIMSAVLVCDSDMQATTSFANAGIGADAIVSVDVDATATSPTIVRIHVEWTYDD